MAQATAAQATAAQATAAQATTAQAATACTGPRWLDERERRAWLAFLATAGLLEDVLDRQLQRDADLPHAYYQVLAMLSEAPEHAMRMTRLAEVTNSSPSRISHAVARLEASGWVQRTKCATDKRGSVAILTEAGFEVVRAAAPGHVEAVRRYLFDALTPEQVDQLAGICAAVLAAVSADRPG